MKPNLTLLLALSCTIPLGASAQVPDHGRVNRAGHIRSAHRYVHHARGAVFPPGYGGPYGDYARGGAFNAGAAQVPPRGFYDNYYGPGATVLRRGLAAQYEPGATQELAPDAKQTATGGPVGGLPGRSGP